MILAGKHEVPDHCPENCPHHNDLSNYGQGAICGRCPILVCSEPEPLVPADAYREDWALVWSAWFKSDMKSYPKLLLIPEKVD